jgi:hypothetical protein
VHIGQLKQLRAHRKGYQRDWIFTFGEQNILTDFLRFEPSSLESRTNNSDSKNIQSLP